MYGLEVSIATTRGLVAMAGYRALLDDVRTLLTQVDVHPRGATTAQMIWGLRHRQTGPDITVRVEPFDPLADQDRTRRTALAVVSGVQELSQGPRIPEYFSEAAVETLGKIGNLATDSAKSGIEAVSLAAANGQVLDSAQVTAAVRANAQASVEEVTQRIATVEGVVDVLGGGARKIQSAKIYNPTTRRAVTVRLRGEQQVDLFREAWGRRVAVRGPVTYNRLGQAIRIAADEVVTLPDQPARHELAQIIGIGRGWTGDRSVQDVMDKLRRRG